MKSILETKEMSCWEKIVVLLNSYSQLLFLWFKQKVTKQKVVLPNKRVFLKEIFMCVYFSAKSVLQ